MDDASSHALHRLRAEWRERLRAARDRAMAQVEEMGIADLRALRATIEEEMARLEERLPDPVPLEARGPMRSEEQAQHVQHALQYNALRVRKQIVAHELRRRALGPAAVEQEVDVQTVGRVVRPVDRFHRVGQDLRLLVGRNENVEDRKIGVVRGSRLVG